MSEIKGQLLGIILTIAVFGIVCAGMIAAFTTVTSNVQNQVEEAALIVTSENDDSSEVSVNTQSGGSMEDAEG